MIGAPLLVRWYGTVAAIAALLAAQAIVLPRWPSAPSPLPRQPLEAALRREGLLAPDDPPSAVPAWPASRGFELSTSAPVVFPLTRGLTLTLMAGSVRQRLNLQAAFIGRDQPSLSLEQRREIRTPTPSAAGRIQKDAALQTCLVRGRGLVDGYGVTWEELGPFTDRLASGWVAGLERIAGLQPNRDYGCTLISLRGARGTPPSPETWEQVLSTVEPVLRTPD
ncbi:hypothetical protein [Synechococcus sp. CCY 9618]|uniref:hypothetical protein n=1 Tax=Synechococcus sp. CCY 9618 TaxID=2815602 RepID=UPI001C226F8D|nr:hypothetical protein [Synechococcus sp. CCY 9618]